MILPSLVEIITVVLAKIFECCQYIFTIPLSSSRWKKVCPFFRPNLNLLHQRIFFIQMWLKLAQWFWRSILDFVNVHLNLKPLHSRKYTDRQIDIRKAHLRIQLRGPLPELECEDA